MRSIRRIEPPDVWLLGVVVALVAAGVLLVFDASYARSGDLKAYGYDTWYFARRQIAYAAAGLVCMFVASIVPVELLRKLSAVGLFIASALLVAVLIPGIGYKVNGSQSWFRIGPFSFQPSELAKLMLVLYLARALGRPNVFARRAERKWAWPFWAAAGVVLLVVAERDLGTAVVLSAIAFVMFAAAGAKKRCLILSAMCGAAAVWLLMCTVPHCKPRVDAFKDPWAHRYDKGYQVVHSLIGFGTGGLTGVGLGKGRVKAYIPAASTDYIYATVAEETGLVGSLVLLGMFVLFTLRGFAVARKCSSLYASLVASGITSAVAMQAIVNMAVATNSVPATGLPLPFISYGGSSMVIMLTGVGLLLSVSRQVKVELDNEANDEDSPHGRWNRRTPVSGRQRGTGALGDRALGRAIVRG
ncbi:MAG: putative lipid II flippase FtsW [Armatimonadota bacterium]